MGLFSFKNKSNGTKAIFSNIVCCFICLYNIMIKYIEGLSIATMLAAALSCVFLFNITETAHIIEFTIRAKSKTEKDKSAFVDPKVKNWVLCEFCLER